MVGFNEDGGASRRIGVCAVSSGLVLATYAMDSRTVLPPFITRCSERESVVRPWPR